MKKQTTITLKVGDKTKEQMLDFFEDLKKPTTPPYAVFQAKDGDTTVTLYESGKAVFQGLDADLASDFWIETGDYFGPIVVTASYVSKENIDYLLDLKVKDSKKMTDKDILEVVPKIIKKIPYKTYILGNRDYNKSYKDYNMNNMKAILHNKVLYELKENNYLYDYIVVDQFENPKSYYNHISKSSKQVKNILFLTKAEDQCLSVACSSLISRYIFLKEMDKLSKSVGINLPKGANPRVDTIGMEIVSKYGKDKLYDIAKLNFKNTDKILDN